MSSSKSLFEDVIWALSNRKLGFFKTPLKKRAKLHKYTVFRARFFACFWQLFSSARPCESTKGAAFGFSGSEVGDSSSFFLKSQMFLNDEVMKKADCMRITFHTVGLLYPDFVIVSPKNLRQRVLLFSDVLPSALFGYKPPCSEVA